MHILLVFLAFVFLLSFIISFNACASNDPDEYTIYITNDNCPDYTWGFTEEQTRQAFADIVLAHLDEMNRTDAEHPENQDRYNMAVMQEAICFVERYPERKNELIQRIKEGRIYVSPYLCNSLWAFQSVESAIRTFYPARRLEKEWGISFEIAEHIEEPSLPWGVASILAGCGVRWLSNPFYKYDSTFGNLDNPPVFIFEGPDGSKINVVMDPWACGKWSYHQGSNGILKDTKLIENEWLPYYRSLGNDYPLNVILASGTHGDINPNSGKQAKGFADGIINYNKNPEKKAKLVNAILPQFCDIVDKAQEEKPFMKVIRGCFGHSWDSWPVSLAKYVAYMREGERTFLSAEALLAIASQNQPDILESTRSQRERGEWLWAMLSDHAWNGTNDDNKRHNSELRRKWGEEFNQIGKELIKKGWSCLGAKEDNDHLTLFNSLSASRSDLVKVEVSSEIQIANKEIPSQIVEEFGKKYLYFVSPEIPGFDFDQLDLKPMEKASKSPSGRLKATPLELESPYYRLLIDSNTGGVSSLIYKPTGSELISKKINRTLCQTVYFDGNEHLLESINSKVVANGSVLARLQIDGVTEGIQVTNFITVYADLDRIDFDVHIQKPVTTKEDRLCQVFPIMQDGSVLRLETTGAVIIPKAQPEGDLLTFTDTRRFAIQGFIDASLPDGLGVTIAPLDAFLLRNDLEPITFEAIGNDQNYREVSRDQGCETQFRFRYSLKAHPGKYNNAKTFAWSRNVSTPILVTKGIINTDSLKKHSIGIDPDRATAICLKPADQEGNVIRLWEVAGKSGEFSIDVKVYKHIYLTDLLERNIKELSIINGKVNFNLPAYGFVGLLMLL